MVVSHISRLLPQYAVKARLCMDCIALKRYCALQGEVDTFVDELQSVLKFLK